MQLISRCQPPSEQNPLAEAPNRRHFGLFCFLKQTRLPGYEGQQGSPHAPLSKQNPPAPRKAPRWLQHPPASPSSRPRGCRHQRPTRHHCRPGPKLWLRDGAAPALPPSPCPPPPPSQRALTPKTNLCVPTITRSVTLGRAGDEKGFSKTSVAHASVRAFEHDANSLASPAGQAVAQPWATQPERPRVSPCPGCSKPTVSEHHLQPLHPAAPHATQANACPVMG